MGGSVPVLSDNIKPIAEAVLARGGPARLLRALGNRRDCVLAYHNVLPDGAESGGDTSLHVRRSRFADHLDRIQETCRVVPLSRILDEPTSDDGRTRVALTFDDGYRGALAEGLEEVEQRGLSATVFVPPRTLGGRTFWWDLVVDRNGEPLRGMARRVALEIFRGEEERVLEWADRAGLGRSEVHPMARSASLAELDRAAARPGVTLAPHGWSHANLAALDDEEVAAELERSLAWLRQRYGTAVIPVVSYPYGRSSPGVERRARAAGYRAGMGVSGGALPRMVSEPMALPRINVPSGLSSDGLHLRLSGILS